MRELGNSFVVPNLWRIWWLEWLIVVKLIYWSFREHARWNRFVFTIDVMVGVEDVLYLRTLRERLILDLCQVVSVLFPSKFLCNIVAFIHVRNDSCKCCSFADFTNLRRIGQEVPGSSDDISFFISEVLFDVLFLLHVRIWGNNLLLHNLYRDEPFVVYSLDGRSVNATGQGASSNFVGGA